MREMEIPDRALRAVQKGEGLCTVLAGEAGFGKSRLAAERSNNAVYAHFLLLQGYCSEQDSSFPYAPRIDALRALLAS
jgi:predicted ATPase